MIVIPDEQGNTYDSQDKFEGNNKDILHNGRFYKLGEMVQIQLLRLHLGESI